MSSVTQDNSNVVEVPSRRQGRRRGALIRHFSGNQEEMNLEYQGASCSESEEGDVSFEGDCFATDLDINQRCECAHNGREAEENDMVRSPGSSMRREMATTRGGRKPSGRGIIQQPSGEGRRMQVHKRLQRDASVELVADGVEPTQKSKNEGETEEQVMFSCNICYELASEPVVTLCGHLYCWPCLYKWLQVQNNYRTCPVCKAGVDRDKVIPVYGRGGNEDPRAKKMETVVPSRPTGQRPQPVDNRNGLIVGGGQSGVFPSIFGFSSGATYQDHLTPEQQHQAFLSRLLLMLGSFVIMCLLLF